MRYGLIPESLRERAMLRFAPHVRLMFESFLPLVTTRALMGFVELGLPRALADRARSAAELAEELGLREDGLRLLLRVMEACGYVRALRPRRGGPERYQLTRLSRATLLEGSSTPLEAWVRNGALHWKAMSLLEGTLTSAGPRRVHHDQLGSAEEWALYQRTMFQMARPLAPGVAELLPPPAGRGLVLDVGGSHGLYGGALCRRFPPMRCRVIDLPEAIASSRALGQGAGLGDVVEWVEGDALLVDLGQRSCDVVFLGNIIHHFDDPQLRDLLARARRALRPGGVVAIWDMDAPREDAAPDLLQEAFSLMFFLTSAAARRPARACSELLRQAGFEGLAVRRGPSPAHVLVTGRAG